MKKEERHQIKRDDLATVLQRVMVYVEDNRRPVIITAAAVVIAVTGGVLVNGWLQTRADQASRLVGEMIQAYNLPIVQTLEDLQRAPAGTESFTSTEERDRKVLEQADAILAEYGSADAIPKALYYKGLALANLERHDEAIEALKRIVDEYPGDFLAPVARFNMARVRESQGNPQEALTHFQALMEVGRGTIPPEEGLLGMARCHEALGETEEAVRTYQRIVDEFSGSEYIGDARAKIDELS